MISNRPILVAYSRNYNSPDVSNEMHNHIIYYLCILKIMFVTSVNIFLLVFVILIGFKHCVLYNSVVIHEKQSIWVSLLNGSVLMLQNRFHETSTVFRDMQTNKTKSSLLCAHNELIISTCIHKMCSVKYVKNVIVR